MYTKEGKWYEPYIPNDREVALQTQSLLGQVSRQLLKVSLQIKHLSDDLDRLNHPPVILSQDTHLRVVGEEPDDFNP